MTTDRVLAVLPVPISPRVLSDGGIEKLVLRGREIRFRIPPGGAPGSRLRLPGLAFMIDKSLGEGDIHLLILPETERIYQPQRDIRMELPLSPRKLLQGSRETLRVGARRVEVRVPAGSRHGQQLRLAGLATACNGGYPGDVFLRLTQPKPSLRLWGVPSSLEQLVERRIRIGLNLFFLQIEQEWSFKTVDLGLHIHI